MDSSSVAPFLLFLLLTVLSTPPTLSTNDEILSLLTRMDSNRPSPSVQESAARGLLRRILPSHSPSFHFQIAPKDVCGGGYSCFFIGNYQESGEEGGPEITIKGTTAVEIASGLHWYLKYWCGAHISWDKTGGSQLASIPPVGSLPRVKDAGVIIKRPVPWNYYQNVVTSSYSYVWWDWPRWEKEVDWMALQGINLPLAFTGQEAIWQKVFMDFNISREELNDFFGGPAFLAWARMGNLHGWGGPLSQNWLDQQLHLQKRILQRMFELGMTPVLPSFSGNVPAALKKIYPSANITRLGDWNTVDGNPKWCCTYLLNPSDPMFIEIGEAFIKKQIAEYGDVTDIYNCDTFNENAPPTDDPTYISSLGAAVYKAMSKGDKDSVWLMQVSAVSDEINSTITWIMRSLPLLPQLEILSHQDPNVKRLPSHILMLGKLSFVDELLMEKQGWLFYSDSAFWKPTQMKALLHSVPFGKMIVLDLFADVKPIWKSSSQFYGTPYIWCLLHNFGGNIEMYGVLDSMASGPIDARVSENSTMVGVGMCMEGIEHNPVVYELMAEMSFRSKKVVVSDWLKGYSRRRYGQTVHKMETAWETLFGTIYNCSDGIAYAMSAEDLHSSGLAPSSALNISATDHNTDFIVKLPDWDPSTVSGYDVTTPENMVFPHLQKRRALSPDKDSNFPKAHIWYNTKLVIDALKLFLDSGDHLDFSPTYRYDLVDLTRQVLSKLANTIYVDAVTAFLQKNPRALHVTSQKFVQLIKDIDLLLAADDNFLLGTWLQSAKALASTPSEMRRDRVVSIGGDCTFPCVEFQYEWNARTQVTMWYDTTKTNQSKLHDYANKFWSGLLEDYYLPRASSYFEFLKKSLKDNKKLELEEWREEWISYSNKWQSEMQLYPVKAQGNALEISRTLYTTYFA